MGESIGNRGMDWEKLIASKCKTYRDENKALIFKLPTDWQVLRSGKNIVSAFPKQKSLVDFFGVLKDGRAISIEAKRVSSKTSFPFTNIKEHQYQFFKEWRKLSDLGFYLIWFKPLDEKFLVDSNKIEEARETIGRKSLPIDWFRKNAYVLDDNLDFLAYIDEIKK